MEFKLLELGGYTDAIARLRMSTGKYYSWEKIRDIQKLVYLMTNEQGFLLEAREDYEPKLETIYDWYTSKKITGEFEKDKEEFKRLLQLTFNQAMGQNKHHTLMKGIDITFITEGLHRGAQDDLDAHAIAFNNRITRFSTRLAEIEENELSEWYEDKVIPFYNAFQMIEGIEEIVPDEIVYKDEIFHVTPFGYVHEKYSQTPAKNGLAKDVQRGGMLLGMPSNAIWKIDLFNLRYVYKMRSKLTKANPELKQGIEQLADQIEKHLPVFGEYFRKERTSTGDWEHVNKVKTVPADEYREFLKWKNNQ